jgi:thiol-disulfide isomerase/thioredoxin
MRTRTLTILCCSAIALAGMPQFLAAGPSGSDSHTLTATDATSAWDELTEAVRLPPPPAAWKVAAPTHDDQAKFYMPFALALQDKSKDFYTRFPKDAHALDARKREFEATTMALELGAADQQVRLDAEEKSLLSDPTLSENDRFRIRQSDIERVASAKESEGEAAVMEQFEKGIRTLQKEFPNRPETMQMLLQVAQRSDPSKARPLLQEIAASSAPDRLKEMAAGELKKLDAVGKAVDLQFTAVDGRPVDVAALKGKVVLIDFWATWCGPCVGELPHVKEAYDKLHPQGFEIVGISLDQDKDKLTKFVGEHKMEWPQFFDGLYWQNKYAVQFGIESIPAMWLLDKKGVLRDLNARANLSDKVTKLLAE